MNQSRIFGHFFVLDSNDAVIQNSIFYINFNYILIYEFIYVIKP